MSNLLAKYEGRLIGADPEMFLKKKDTGEFYPVVGILGGTKKMPQEVDSKPFGYMYLEDNVMPEFNIPPCSTVEEFVGANSFMIEHIMSQLPTELGLEASFVPAARFNTEYLQTDQAKEFGCSPDTNAYTLRSQKVEAKDAGNLRTAGGHIHIGWKNATGKTEDGAVVARAFDLFCTAPMFLIEPDNERRKLYGSAGSMRSKYYGVECRQLSCFWLSSPQLMAWVYNQTQKALDFAEVNEDIHDPKSKLSLSLLQAIDGKDTAQITALVREYAVDQQLIEALEKVA